MKSFSPTKEQEEALLEFISDENNSLRTARYRLDEFSELVEKGQLPLAFLAFETLEQLITAHENGIDSVECLDVVPEPFASRTVNVPVFVLNTILNCWHDFINSDPTKASLEKSFGFAAPKPSGNPIQHVIEKLQNDRYLAQRVIIHRIKAWSDGKKFPLAQAFVDVAAEEKVSSQTVKSAWYKHRSFYYKLIKDFQLPPKQIG